MYRRNHPLMLIALFATVFLAKGGLAKRLLAEKTLEVDFFKGALQEVEARANGAAILARWHLRLDPRSDVIARQFEYRAHV